MGLRKVFLEDLPKWESGTYKGNINWSNSINHLINFEYDDVFGKVEVISYNKKSSMLTIKYNNLLYNITRQNFCKCRLGNILNKFTRDFKFELGCIIKDDTRDITLTQREYKSRETNGRTIDEKFYKYTCNVCGWTEGLIEESNLRQGKGCSCCCNPPRNIVEGINDIPTTAPWMVKYFQGGYDEAKLYSKCSHKNIRPVCPDCGKISNKTILINDLYRYKSVRCDCGDSVSYPNKFSHEFLQQLSQIYLFNKLEFEYSPDWSGKRRYDNYFEYNDKSYVLEMDGAFHVLDNRMSGTTAYETNLIDKEKDRLAEEHNITIVRIDCYVSDFEYIKNNFLCSELSVIFNLDVINWLKCEEYALSNLVKIVCKLKNDNPNMTTKEMMNYVNLKRATIIKYLKKGSKLGWCDYDPKDETRKSSIKSGRLNGKKVEIFKDNVSLGIFESCHELSRQSEILFKIKLYPSDISEVCRGIKVEYKGFSFKYLI